MRARHTRQVRPELTEDVKHVFHTCPRALWERVTAWWRGATGQGLQVTPRLTLMGDRTQEDGKGDTDFRDLEEPWVLLHAAVLEVIWQERDRVRDGSEPRSTHDLWRATKRRFAEAANDLTRLWERRRQGMDKKERETRERKGGRGSAAYMRRGWLESGVARRTNLAQIVRHVHSDSPLVIAFA